MCCSQRVLPNNPRRGARTLHTYLTSLIVRLFNYDYNYKLVKHCQHNTNRRARRDYRKRNISSLAICTAHTTHNVHSNLIRLRKKLLHLTIAVEIPASKTSEIHMMETKEV